MEGIKEIEMEIIYNKSLKTEPDRTSTTKIITTERMSNT
jgi:hypothetical protein